jgi:hypothetical protein
MDDPTTAAPAAGWVLRASRAELDVDALLERFGQLHRIPVGAGDAAAQLQPGQPCFLVRTDRARVVGLWAIGEVVAPVLHLPAGTPVLPAEGPLGTTDETAERTYAEVELLPVAKPVALEALLTDDRLARSPLTGAGEPGRAPLPLTREQVRAIEAVELWIEEPSEEQRRALDRLLADEDPILDALEADAG